MRGAPAIETGAAAPAGAHWDGQGVNFTLFSRHAERVSLCLFDEQGNEQALPLPGRTGDIWHGYVPGMMPGQRYGYRVDGLWAPEKGLRFNHHKLLLDPCARLVEGEIGDDPALDQGQSAADTRDSAAHTVRSVVADNAFDWEDDRSPRIPWGETVIYEAHVRGLTRQHPALPEAVRGTYQALGSAVMIDYFRALGITTLELMPIATFASEPRLQRMGLSNYWGYNTLAPWAPDARYAAGDQVLSELKTAIKTLHAARIEVILDVVFNHSAELDEAGPVLSLRGIDNASYYWLTPGGEYENWTGCGNVLNLSHPGVMAGMLDCLRYWVETFHVDGFRFDLATVLGRSPAFDSGAALFQAMRDCPVLSQVKCIAEPWDIGPGGYQLSQFPAPFAEWNDQYRDAMRRFWLTGETGKGEFARRFAGSSDLFQHHGRQPSASVNLITAHDGFTLRDLLSFADKHNEANGEENRDGHNANFSNNHGVEGLNAGRDILNQRRQSAQALLTTLLLSQGTPLLLAGDESGHSQQGNNNAYCQDNALTWLDWHQQDDELIAFTAALIQLRRQIPALTQDRWWQEGDGSVEWLNAQGTPLDGPGWEQGEALLQIRLSQHWLITLNATDREQSFQLPAGSWYRTAPFARDAHSESLSVWHGPARGICVFHEKA